MAGLSVGFSTENTSVFVAIFVAFSLLDGVDTKLGRRCLKPLRHFSRSRLHDIVALRDQRMSSFHVVTGFSRHMRAILGGCSPPPEWQRAGRSGEKERTHLIAGSINGG